MQYGAVRYPATMHETPAWVCKQSTVHQDGCDATATPSFPIVEPTSSSSSLSAVNLNHAAHHMDGITCFSVGEDEHVNFGKPPLMSPSSEAPAVPDEQTRSDAMVSGSVQSCSYPVCLDLHTSWSTFCQDTNIHAVYQPVTGWPKVSTARWRTATPTHCSSTRNPTSAKKGDSFASKSVASTLPNVGAI